MRNAVAALATDGPMGGAYWSLPADELLQAIGSSPAGLDEAKAVRRRKQFGLNVIEGERHLGVASLLARQFQSPLTLILLVGATISAALGEWIDASIILAIVLGSALLGFLQEYRASAAMDALKQRLALTAEVLRNGATQRIPVRDLTPGDVVRLSAGALVPADGRILEANDFHVAEAALTGESFPVEKRPGVAPVEAELGARTNCVFLGSSVRSGEAKVLITRTARSTEFGAIAARLAVTPPETDFARGVRRFGYLLLRVTLVMILFVVAANTLLGRPLLQSLLFAIALAIGLSPPLLPAIVSVTLSTGARAMAAKGVIVRRLESIENLGSMDVLCTDKTGTLTAGVINLDGALGPDGNLSERVAELALVNASFETGIENPLDQAIVAEGEKTGRSLAGWRKVAEVPYDFLRKRLTVVATKDGAGAPLAVTKGAFDEVLSICTAVSAPDGETPLDAASRHNLQRYFAKRSQEGFRVLGVAVRSLQPGEAPGRDVESRMTFAGFLLFFDPPKADVQAAIQSLAHLGVGIKMITGDNRHVAAHVASQVGLDPERLVTGAQFARMSPGALLRTVDANDLFVEIDPQQKEQIVLALKRSGHVVGFLGDGVNDAPALHAADVGISVDKAVDVARESADVVLLQQSLEVLCDGVLSGRRTFANTLKYICIAISGNFGNMVSMALATPLLPFLPLLPKQVLLNNFGSDLASITVSTDRVDEEGLTKPQSWKLGDLQRFMVVFGLVSSVFDIATFCVLLFLFHVGEVAFQTAWFVESLLTEVAVIMFLRTRRRAWESAASGLLVASATAIGLFALAAPYVRPLAEVVGFTPMRLEVLAAMLGIVIAYAFATEAAKRWYFHRWP